MPPRAGGKWGSVADVIEKTIVPAVLAGRCANGFERGKGAVVHSVLASENEIRFGINSYTRALCGKTHGSRSAGWSIRREAEVNCPRCMKALAHG